MIQVLADSKIIPLDKNYHIICHIIYHIIARDKEQLENISISIYQEEENQATKRWNLSTK